MSEEEDGRSRCSLVGGELFLGRERKEVEGGGEKSEKLRAKVEVEKRESKLDRVFSSLPLSPHHNSTLLIPLSAPCPRKEKRTLALNSLAAPAQWPREALETDRDAGVTTIVEGVGRLVVVAKCIGRWGAAAAPLELATAVERPADTAERIVN